MRAVTFDNVELVFVGSHRLVRNTLGGIKRGLGEPAVVCCVE